MWVKKNVCMKKYPKLKIPVVGILMLVLFLVKGMVMMTYTRMEQEMPLLPEDALEIMMLLGLSNWVTSAVLMIVSGFVVEGVFSLKQVLILVGISLAFGVLMPLIDGRDARIILHMSPLIMSLAYLVASAVAGIGFRDSLPGFCKVWGLLAIVFSLVIALTGMDSPYVILFMVIIAVVTALWVRKQKSTGTHEAS